MSDQISLSKKPSLIVCMVLWSVFIVGLVGVLTVYLVGTLTETPADADTGAADAAAFDSVVELTEKKVARYLGEWEFSEPKIPGHFHHIGRWYESDKWNFCIECHGPTPHSRKPNQRAFLNMHSLFISCNTCHVREQMEHPPTRFGWISLVNGQPCPNPEMVEGVWGEYGAKIVPLSAGDSPVPVTLKETEAFAAKYRKEMNGLSDRQKVISNKLIHKNCIEKPVNCSDCHKTQKGFLDYLSLGYSPERAAFLMSSEVADLASKYETFYMPSLLNTEDRKPKEAGDAPK